MLIPLGILAASSAAGGSYELIETITVGSGGAASVTFSNLNTYSSTYQHLQIRAVVRGSGAYSQTYMEMQFNADTASNYSHHELYGNGSSVSSSGNANRNHIRAALINANTSTANVFSGVVIDLLDPYETSKYTTARILYGQNGTNFVGLYSGNWRNTDALSSVKLQESSGFAQYSRFSIYGLKGA